MGGNTKKGNMLQPFRYRLTLGTFLVTDVASKWQYLFVLFIEEIPFRVVEWGSSTKKRQYVFMSPPGLAASIRTETGDRGPKTIRLSSRRKQSREYDS